MLIGVLLIYSFVHVCNFHYKYHIDSSICSIALFFNLNMFEKPILQFWCSRCKIYAPLLSHYCQSNEGEIWTTTLQVLCVMKLIVMSWFCFFRGYYKCSSMRGCPARKHVERCLDEPTMLMVTYEGEHNHAKVPTQPANAWTAWRVPSFYLWRPLCDWLEMFLYIFQVMRAGLQILPFG